MKVSQKPFFVAFVAFFIRLKVIITCQSMIKDKVWFPNGLHGSLTNVVPTEISELKSSIFRGRSLNDKKSLTNEKKSDNIYEVFH